MDLTHSKVRSDLIIFQENRGPTLLTICMLIFIILLLIGYMQRDRIRNLFSKVRAAAPEIREAIPDARAAEPAERAAVPNARAAVPIAPAAEQGQFNLRLWWRSNNNCKQQTVSYITSQLQLLSDQKGHCCFVSHLNRCLLQPQVWCSGWLPFRYSWEFVCKGYSMGNYRSSTPPLASR